MDEKVVEDLIIKVAEKMHESWCDEELRAFFNRMQEVQKNGTTRPIEVYEAACYKNGKLRNEVEMDSGYCVLHEYTVARSLNDFDYFKKLFAKGGVDIKRFTNRTLTAEEIKKANRNGHINYKDGQENILTSFKGLSADSRKENLKAAIGACNVYVQFCEADVSIEQMQSDPAIMELIGIAIHTDWLRRNVNHSDDSLKVPYSELDNWTKQQDLTVFSTLLTIVSENKELYHVAKKEGVVIPDYRGLESELLNSKPKCI